MKYKGTIQDYFNIKQSGSIVLFKPETKFAEEWWEELGQLLVVELCNNLRQPELIPDPLAYAFMRSALKYLVNGSGIGN